MVCQPTGPEPIVLAPSHCLFLSLRVTGTSSCLPGVSCSPLCLYGGSPPGTPATPAPLSHPTQVRLLERCSLRDLTFSPGPPEFTFLGSAVLKLESACLPCALLFVFAQLPASAPHFRPPGETALMADRSVDEGQEPRKRLKTDRDYAREARRPDKYTRQRRKA